MGFNKSVNTTNVQFSYGDSETGTASTGVTGGPDTIAISGGGLPVVWNELESQWSDTPIPVPVYPMPSASNASYIELHVAYPDGAKIGIKNAWVIYWEED